MAGYCLQWGLPALIQRDFLEVFERGSVAWSDDLVVCLDHNRDRPIAALHRGLRIAEDARGLWVEIDCPRDEDGDVWLRRACSGDGWSVAFVAKRSATVSIDGEPWRNVARAELIEVSLVRRPAHTTILGRKSALRHRGVIGPFDHLP